MEIQEASQSPLTPILGVRNSLEGSPFPGDFPSLLSACELTAFAVNIYCYYFYYYLIVHLILSYVLFPDFWGK